MSRCGISGSLVGLAGKVALLGGLCTIACPLRETNGLVQRAGVACLPQRPPTASLLSNPNTEHMFDTVPAQPTANLCQLRRRNY